MHGYTVRRHLHIGAPLKLTSPLRTPLASFMLTAPTAAAAPAAPKAAAPLFVAPTLSDVLKNAGTGAGLPSLVELSQAADQAASTVATTAAGGYVDPRRDGTVYKGAGFGGASSTTTSADGGATPTKATTSAAPTREQATADIADPPFWTPTRIGGGIAIAGILIAIAAKAATSGGAT